VGFFAPTAYEDTGSDLHRAYLTRLCSAFGLSQPLDAFLLPNPFRLCFTPVTLLGFALQRLSPLASRPCLSAPSAPPDVLVGESFVDLPAHPPEGRSTASSTNPAPKCAPLVTDLRDSPGLRRGPAGDSSARTRLARAFRGSNLTRDPFIRPAMVSRTTGADPLLGFQPSRVLPLPATTRPKPRSPPMRLLTCVPRQAV
jgi:hypothetical protein